MVYTTLADQRQPLSRETRKLPIGIVSELPGDDGPRSGEEEQLGLGREVSHLIRGKERPPGLMRRVSDAGFGGIERAGHGLELDGFVAEKIGDQARCFVIIDAEDLEHAGIREEGSGAGAIGGFQLVDILEDGPELEAVTRHETHGAFDRGETAEACELVEEEEHGLARLLRFPRHRGEASGEHQAQPAGIGLEAIGRQDEEDRGCAVLEIREGEFGS